MLLIKTGNLEETIHKHANELLNSNCIHTQVLRQHHEINKINPFCVNTIRFDTFIDKSGKTHIFSALMRFWVNGSNVDNANSGGFCVGIDLEEGRLKRSGRQMMRYGGLEFEKHPDSDFIFKDFLIPFFSEAYELVLNAVECIPDRLIGWDVAITESGPVIIEGNITPGMFLSDIAYGGYLKNPLFKEIMEELKYV